MQHLRANTQVIVTVGPFVDVGDGFTPQTDITLAGNEAEILKHGATAVVDISAATWAAVTSCRGYYSLTLTTSHTDTEGMLVVIVQDDSDCLPVKQEYMVLSEAAYDSLYVAKDDGFMDVNIKTVGRADTQETEANNLESACSNYSATRGLTGTALPAAAAAAAGGVPLSTAGSLEMDTLADWVNAGRLDAILDTIAADVVKVPKSDGTTSWNATALAAINTQADTALTDYDPPTNTEMLAATAVTDALVAIAQLDLDKITGTDGATLATAQALYAPAKAGDNMGTVSSVTGNVDGNVTGSVGSNLELGPAEVNAEVLDVLNTDTFAEPGQGVPAATASLVTKIGFLYKAWRNRSNQTATTYQLFADDTTTVDQKLTVSDDATTAEKGEVGTGP